MLVYHTHQEYFSGLTNGTHGEDDVVLASLHRGITRVEEVGRNAQLLIFPSHQVPVDVDAPLRVTTDIRNLLKPLHRNVHPPYLVEDMPS